MYYFKAPFTFSGTGNSKTYYFGGAPASYETVTFLANQPSCASDGVAASSAVPAGSYTASGTGVQFIFGNRATVTVDDKSRAELFERTADGTEQTSSPTVVAVPSSWAPGWLPNPIHTDVLAFTPGADKALVIHGLTYAPDHNILFKVTNVVNAVVFGGVVAWHVELDTSQGGGGNGLVVTARNGKSAPRHIVVRATAPFPVLASAGRQVVSTAVVQITNDTPAQVTIESWRTGGPSDPF